MSADSEDARKHSVRRVEIRRVADAVGAAPTADVVAAEEPLGIRLGYSRPDGSRAEEDVSITMRTPGHDADLAVGFLFTEGIIHSRAEVEGVVPRGERDANGLFNSVRVDLAPGVKVDFKRLERHFYTSSSCGICGKASLDLRGGARPVRLARAPFRIDAAALGRLAGCALVGPRSIRADRRSSRLRLVRFDRHDRRGARGRGPAQRARQADRRRAACTIACR